MENKDCDRLAKLFNSFVDKSNKLSCIIEIYHSGFTPSGEEAKRFAKQETDVLFQQVDQALLKVKKFLNEKVYKGE